MNPLRQAPSSRQRGEFNLPRLATICAILVAILLVPLYYMKGKTKARPTAVTSPASAASSVTGTASR